MNAEKMMGDNAEFLIMLAHELRNPLNPMQTSLHIIEQHADTTLLKSAALVLRRQINHSKRVIENLLNVSKLVQGTLKLDKKSISLKSVIEKSVELARDSFNSRKQILEQRLPESSILLLADKELLVNCISNLLLNAAKFTETCGKINLTVSYNDNKIILVVKDNGIGIDKNQISQIFNLFTQNDHSQQLSTGGGLGVGLTLTRGVIRLHGGDIDVHSEGLGQGSEFIVTLPATLGYVPDEVDVPNIVSKKSYEILMVDDHIDTAESTATLLKLLGHTVRLAHSGPEAIKIADIYSPDIVISDIGLPGLDGYQVAETIKKQNPAIMLVAVSGYGQDIDKRRSTKAGFSVHLVKPVDLKTLENALTK